MNMSAPGTSSGMVGTRLSIMMFLQFFVWGAWYVSMTGWMGTHGLGGLTAWAYTVGPIAAVISPFFLGMVADRFFSTQKVLGVMHLLGGAALIAVPQVVSALVPDTPLGFMHPYVLLLLAHMLCYMPTLGLTNTLSFHHMTNPERQFPMVRVFGTIGWIVGNIVVGGSLTQWGVDLTWIAEGDKSPMQFHIAGGAAVLLGLFSFTLPHTPPPAAGKDVGVADVMGLKSLQLFARPGYAVFILCSFLICIPLAGYYNYARTYVEAAGFQNPTMTMSYGQMSEIVFMILMPAFFARLGVKWMLAAGMLAWVARYGLFAAAADDHVKWMTLTGIILHGICYDFFFVTGFIYVDKTAPPEIRGQAQGFLVLITQGLGLGLGAQLFGKLTAHYTTGEGAAAVMDWKHIWLWPALFAAAVMLIFIALFRDRSTSRLDA
jgi:nucleoside transporter